MFGFQNSEDGVLSSARRLIDKTIDLVQNRIELFSVEMQEEKCRLVEALIWASACVFTAGLALLLITVTVIFAVWEQPQARLLALIVFSVLYAASAVTCFFILRKKLYRSSKPFEETLNELKKDKEWLSTRN